MSSFQADVITSAAAPAGRTTHFRWAICALLFVASTINYVDRSVLGVLAPLLQKTIGWNELQYGYIVTAFSAAYALGLLVAGGFIDRVGTKIGYAVAIAIWSLAAMGHSLVHSVLGFGIARFMLGLGESGNFPAAIKAVAEWFPRRERALATGIFNSGANVGAMLAPLAVPWIAVTIGWRWAFVFTGFFSVAWLISWLAIYSRPAQQPRVSPAELAIIESDPADTPGKTSWAGLLTHSQTWAFVIPKLMTDPVWWFFLFWLPKFLNSQYGLTITKIGPPLFVIYNLTAVGSIGGGWLAARFLKMKWSVNRARKTTMLICALAVLPIVFVTKVHSLWGAVALISLATAAHQGWSANLFTMASDMFPRKAVASVVGMGGFGGAVVLMFVATGAGYLLQLTGNYLLLFVLAGSAYLVALAIIQVLSPRLTPVEVGRA